MGTGKSMLMSAPGRIRFTVPALALTALLVVGLAACSASAASQDAMAVEGISAAASPTEASSQAPEPAGDSAIDETPDKTIDVISISDEIDSDSVESAELVPDPYEDLATQSTTENGDVDAEAVSLLSSATSTLADLGEGCDI